MLLDCFFSVIGNSPKSQTLNVNSIDLVRSHKGVPPASSLLFHAAFGTVLAASFKMNFSQALASSND